MREAPSEDDLEPLADRGICWNRNFVSAGLASHELKAAEVASCVKAESDMHRAHSFFVVGVDVVAVAAEFAILLTTHSLGIISVIDFTPICTRPPGFSSSTR